MRLVNGFTTEVFLLLLGAVSSAGFVVFNNHKTRVLSTTTTQTAYYVDCQNGSDSNSGTSEASPWKTISKANNALLHPGDSLLIKRGTVCEKSTNGQFLTAKWVGTESQPILIGAYGTGDKPIIQFNVGGTRTKNYAVNVHVTGAYQIIENIETRVINHWVDVACRNQAVGFYVGFNFAENAHHNILRNTKSTGHTAGVHFVGNTSISLDRLPHHNLVTRNEITNNWVMQTLTPDALYDDIGAWGINLKGSDNEISYNYLRDNNGLCVYESEGSAATAGYQGNSIELFMAKRNFIHHNRAFNDRAFSEIGGDVNNKSYNSEDNIFAYNLYASPRAYTRFITQHGPGTRFGPTYRTKVYNNTVFLTGSNSQGIVCAGGCPTDVNGTSMTVKNNVVWATEKAYFTTVGANFSESNNIFWNGNGVFPSNYFQNQTPSGSSLKVSPIFINSSSENFRLSASSPAINSGSQYSEIIRLRTDLDDKIIPIGSAIDIGGYEYEPLTSTTPIPSPTLIPSPTSTPTPRPTPTPTPVPIPTLTSTPVPTSEPTNTPSPVPTPVPVGDVLAPLVNITNPTQGGMIFRINLVNITTEVNDEGGVSKVEFFVNDRFMGQDTTEPYSLWWKVWGKPNAVYNIRVRATDVSGNVGEDSVQVRSW